MTQSLCICKNENCPKPITVAPRAAHVLRIAQAWADLRVTMAKSVPDHDPTTTDHYYSLRDAIRDVYAEYATSRTAEAIGDDTMHLAHTMTLHELLYSVSQGIMHLRRIEARK